MGHFSTLIFSKECILQPKMGVFKPRARVLRQAFLAKRDAYDGSVAAEPGNQCALAGSDHIKPQKISVKPHRRIQVLEGGVAVGKKG